MTNKAIQTSISEDEYEKILNEQYPPIEIFGMEYGSGKVLRDIDETAFEQMFADDEDNIRWECRICGEVYDLEENAENCCELEEED